MTETNTRAGKVATTSYQMCAVCQRLLATDATFDRRTGIITTKPIRWEHDGRGGFLCDDHRPSFWTNHPHDDPDTPERCPAIRERAILDALTKHPEGLTAIELQDVTDIKRTTIIKRLDVMAGRGQARKEKHKYFLQTMSPA